VFTLLRVNDLSVYINVIGNRGWNHRPCLGLGRYGGIVELIFGRLWLNFGTGGSTFMKTYILRLALALGFLVCAGRTATAQQLSTAPIIIRLSEIDRYAVSEWSLPKAMDGAMLGLPYRDMKQSEVDTLVRYGMILNRPVWVMGGAGVIAKCKLIGGYVSQPDPKSKAKYGF
jgi:hypothetical protein